mmetsp:Transcript_92055/g.180390  ORF Transcript_92055/g.180390 Transcript_92055/m.180390 type:complete len:264 (+) Transcript_92055:44-835(+)
MMAKIHQRLGIIRIRLRTTIKITGKLLKCALVEVAKKQTRGSPTVDSTRCKVKTATARKERRPEIPKHVNAQPSERWCERFYFLFLIRLTNRFDEGSRARNNLPLVALHRMHGERRRILVVGCIRSWAVNQQKCRKRLMLEVRKRTDPPCEKFLWGNRTARFQTCNMEGMGHIEHKLFPKKAATRIPQPLRPIRIRRRHYLKLFPPFRQPPLSQRHLLQSRCSWLETQGANRAVEKALKKLSRQVIPSRSAKKDPRHHLCQPC